jgi:hypothetical protein
MEEYTRREFLKASFRVVAGTAVLSPLSLISCAEKPNPFNDGTTDKGIRAANKFNAGNEIT